MKKAVPFLPLVILALILGWQVELGRRSGGPDSSSGLAVPLGTTSGLSDPALPPSAKVVADQETTPQPNEKQAFRLRIEDGGITFNGVEDLRGNFRQPRGDLEGWAGMFYYRLLDQQSRVLAEDVQPAPDFRCVVVDPMSRDAAGRPRAVSMTIDRPLDFQVRLPKFETAAVLEVYRLSGPLRAGSGVEGLLLTSIPLQK